MEGAIVRARRCEKVDDAEGEERDMEGRYVSKFNVLLFVPPPRSFIIERGFGWNARHLLKLVIGCRRTMLLRLKRKGLALRISVLPRTQSFHPVLFLQPQSLVISTILDT